MIDLGACCSEGPMHFCAPLCNIILQLWVGTSREHGILDLPNAQAKAQQQKMSAKTAKKMAKRHAYTGGAAVSGLSSSLAFTPVQARLNLVWGDAGVPVRAFLLCWTSALCLK